MSKNKPSLFTSWSSLFIVQKSNGLMPPGELPATLTGGVELNGVEVLQEWFTGYFGLLKNEYINHKPHIQCRRKRLICSKKVDA